MNKELSEIFGQIAEILEFRGGANDRFRIRAFQNAALILNGLSEDVTDIARRGSLRDIRGIGDGIAGMIEEFIDTGEIREYEDYKKSIPAGIFELLSVPFLGPKKVKLLYRRLHVKSIKDLEAAVKSGKVEELPGFGKRSAEKLLEGIAMKREQHGRSLIGEVFATVYEIVRRLESHPLIMKVEPAGSFRRREETVGDIDILATGKDPEKITADFTRFPQVKHILGQGDTKASVMTHEGIQIDLRVVAPSEFGSALQYFTGSKAHNVHLRTYAKQRGFTLSEYGFFKLLKNGEKKLLASKTEKECYEAIGLQYIPPEMRTDTGEIEAAIAGELPKLIELSDIKGDLHTHSLWSDGANTIEQMARAAESRGYEYISISDHSPSLRVANGLSLERLKLKKKELDAVQKKVKIEILFGTEVDILADGSIDYPDNVLREFDVVVASVHSRFNQDNTERIMRAIENPYVNVIAHPSGRKIGERKPYPVDMERVMSHAKKHGVALEVNGHYMRLDLEDRYIRDAKKMGVKLAIGSDAHSVDGLCLMDLGVSWARRGWLEKSDVINTMPLQKLRGFLGRVKK